MKLVIQIPCLNEADYLPATLAALPRQVEGFDEVRWLIIDDGSTDNTKDILDIASQRRKIRLCSLTLLVSTCTVVGRFIKFDSLLFSF